MFWFDKLNKFPTIAQELIFFYIFLHTSRYIVCLFLNLFIGQHCLQIVKFYCISGILLFCKTGFLEMFLHFWATRVANVSL